MMSRCQRHKCPRPLNSNPSTFKRVRVSTLQLFRDDEKLLTSFPAFLAISSNFSMPVACSMGSFNAENKKFLSYQMIKLTKETKNITCLSSNQLLRYSGDLNTRLVFLICLIIQSTAEWYKSGFLGLESSIQMVFLRKLLQKQRTDVTSFRM